MALLTPDLIHSLSVLPGLLTNYVDQRILEWNPSYDYTSKEKLPSFENVLYKIKIKNQQLISVIGTIKAILNLLLTSHKMIVNYLLIDNGQRYCNNNNHFW